MTVVFFMAAAPPAYVIVNRNYDTMNRDSADYIERMESLKSGNDTAVGKDYVAMFYNFIAKGISPVVIPLVAFAYFFAVTAAALAFYPRPLVQFGVFALNAFPMIIWLAFVSKEGILMLVISATIFASWRSTAAARIFFVAAMTCWTIFVRLYYAPLLVGAIGISLFGWKRGLIILAFLVPIAIAFGDPIIEKMNGARYAMWYSTSTHSTGANTIIYLDWSREENAIKLVKNYFLSAGQIIFPFSVRVSLKEAFFAVEVLAIAYAAISAVRNGDRLPAAFGIFLLLWLPTFVVDLGACLRHATMATMFLYLSMSMRAIGETGRGLHVVSRTAFRSEV